MRPVVVFLGVFLVVASNVALFWVGASALTSIVKAGTDSCAETYQIEYVLDGNWFCPEEG